tara:strand:- start:19 stop:660 length:642 start_codon:yes stop_codon:yes gene_type:complete
MNQTNPLDNTLLLFSTPVFMCNEYSSTVNGIHDTANERKDVRENIGGNFASVETKVLNLESYKIIRDRVMFGLSQYVNDVLFVDPAYEFYITQSWLNFNEPGTTHHRHNHSNSLISGVYYIDTLPEDNITFISNNNDTVTTNSTLQIDVTNYNLTNSNQWTVPVTNNDIIFFPSKTFHEVNPNMSDKTRISLSFNIFVKGKLGDETTLNELNL